MNIIETERLLLRTWTPEDAQAYFRINQDPKVIEFLLSTLTMAQVDDFMTRANQTFKELGYTLWAVDEKTTGSFIGFIGLDLIKWAAPFGPGVEIAWRLDSQYWGKGYATEGAKAALDYGFNHCGLTEIVSFTVPENIRSIRVMEKIGMKHDIHGDFLHPKLPLAHRLSKHVLYRISNKK